MMGCSPGLVGKYSSMDFYVSGLTPTGNIETVTLYMSGLTPSVTSEFTLYMSGLYTTATMPLYMKGYFTDSDFPYLLADGARHTATLCMYGTGTDPAGPGSTIYNLTGTMTAYIYGSGAPTTGYLTSFVHGLDSTVEDIRLYTSGVNGYNNSELPLYIRSYELLTSGIDLVIRGY